MSDNNLMQLLMQYLQPFLNQAAAQQPSQIGAPPGNPSYGAQQLGSGGAFANALQRHLMELDQAGMNQQQDVTQQPPPSETMPQQPPQPGDIRPWAKIHLPPEQWTQAETEAWTGMKQHMSPMDYIMQLLQSSKGTQQ